MTAVICLNHAASGHEMEGRSFFTTPSDNLLRARAQGTDYLGQSASALLVLVDSIGIDFR